MLTPWDQQCGNAEFAKKLVHGLQPIATIEPIELFNFTALDRRMRRADVNAYLRGLIKQINDARVDIVHIQHEFCFFGHSIASSNRTFLRLMRSIKKPAVISLHTLRYAPDRSTLRKPLKWAAESLRLLWRSRHLKHALGHARSIVLHGKHTQQIFNATFRPLKKRCRVIPFPVEITALPRDLPRFVKNADEKWVVLPGFVSRYKGHPQAIQALSLLPPSYKLVIAGGVHPKDTQGYEYWVELLLAIDARGLQDRVIFTGFIDAEEQAGILDQADVFLLPYDEVGQSGSAVLADVLAYDRPVITSHARSMFVYRNEQDTTFSSIAIDATDAQAVADTVLAAACDEHRSFPQSRSGRAAVRTRYSFARTREAYAQIYNSVITPEDFR